MAKDKHFPIVNGRGKMSPQAACGTHSYPNDDSRQSKYRKRSKHGTRKLNGKRRHRS